MILFFSQFSISRLSSYQLDIKAYPIFGWDPQSRVSLGMCIIVAIGRFSINGTVKRKVTSLDPNAFEKLHKQLEVILTFLQDNQIREVKHKEITHGFEEGNEKERTIKTNGHH